jgi:hypothetical protein
MCSIAAVGALRFMEGASLHATSWLRFHDSDVLPLSITCLATCVVGECALRVTPHQQLVSDLLDGDNAYQMAARGPTGHYIEEDLQRVPQHRAENEAA